MSFFEDIGPVASIASGFVPGVGGQILGGLGAIGGLLGASSERKRQERARAEALRQMSVQLDQDYQNIVSSHARTLGETTGYAGDAIQSLARGLGSANAAAGVTNSSAVAGSNALATQSSQREIANLGARNRDNELNMLGENKRYLAGLQFNLAGENFNNAALRENQAGSGLMSYLGKLGQFNLQNQNAPNARNMGDVMNGNQNGAVQGSVIGGQVGSSPRSTMDYRFSDDPNNQAMMKYLNTKGSYGMIPRG